MAITFQEDADALVTLLSRGGYAVRAVKAIAGSRGRSADLYLKNGVVLCWDSITRKVWADRVSRRGERVEAFLEKMCEGPRILRVLAIIRARITSSHQSWNQTAALWLLRSEGFIARNLRQQLCR